MRRVFLLLLAGLVLLIPDNRPTRPELRFAPDTPNDLRVLADKTWTRFTDVFSGRWGCIPPVTLVGDWELEPRAEYLIETRTIRVRIPATADDLATALAHEFAHHVEYTCPAFDTLRPAFLAAQGLEIDTPWDEGPHWEFIPAEQWAEAAIEVTLGYRVVHRRIPITDDAKATIRVWAAGDDP